jgi:hypothetical protein
MGPNGTHGNVYGEVFNANPNATRYRQRYRSSALLRYLSAISALSDTVSYWRSLLVLLCRDTRPAMAAAAAVVSLSRHEHGEQTHQTSLTCRIRRKTLFAFPTLAPLMGV